MQNILFNVLVVKLNFFTYKITFLGSPDYLLTIITTNVIISIFCSN